MSKALLTELSQTLQRAQYTVPEPYGVYGERTGGPQTVRIDTTVQIIV
jgi:hypothetical protein